MIGIYRIYSQKYGFLIVVAEMEFLNKNPVEGFRGKSYRVRM